MILLYLENLAGLDQLGVLVLIQALALLIDKLIGEPKRFHPLVGFGKFVALVEAMLNRGGPIAKTAKGTGSWFLLILPITLLCTLILHWLALWSVWLFWLANLTLLYLAIGLNSLAQHASWVAAPLEEKDLSEARAKVSWLVSRNTKTMDETEINKACIESVLENGNDAVFGALFWFLIAGAPGALLYRLANTLDACWGYRNKRYREFGWWSARTDDWLNLIPARICATAYGLSGHWRNAIRSWKDISNWRKSGGRHIGSPNAGIVMASGAGALNLRLGGSAIYHGKPVEKPSLGFGNQPVVQDIYRSLSLLKRATAMFIFLQVLLYAFIASSVFLQN